MLRQNRSAGRDCSWTAPHRRLRVEPLEDRRLLAITVDTLLDVVDDGDGVTSLREAIATANSTSENEINFSVTGEISIGSELPAISSDLTIEGPGPELLRIDAGNGLDGEFGTGDGWRIFLISDGDGGSELDVTLTGLTLTGGDTPNGVDDSPQINGPAGGAVASLENLTVIDSVISGNATGDGANSSAAFGIGGTGGYGGGIFAGYGRLRVLSSTISGNKTGTNGFGTVQDGRGGQGGGIAAINATVEIMSSVISDNTTAGRSAYGGGVATAYANLMVSESLIIGNSTDGSFASGGGIGHRFGNLTIENSTIANNQAQGNGAGGGGVYARIPEVYGVAKLSASTISGNTTTEAEGGGVESRAYSMTLNSVTITRNSAPIGNGGGVASFGGNYGQVQIANSIIASNGQDDLANTSDFGNPFVSGGYNLVGDVEQSSDILDAFNQPGDSVGIVSPLLAPLADNGGPTQTHALLPGSPALDAGRAMFVNVAREGVANQSSDFDDEFLANRAIDGNTATPTHTLIDDSNPHWQVELAAEHTISEIVLHNRDDCCQSRLRDITVQILDNFDNVVFTSELLNPENVLGGSMVNVGPETLHLDLVELTGSAVAGRKVLVTRTPDPDFSGSGGVGPVGEENVLSLGEVEIFAVDQRGRPRVVDGGSGLRQDIGAYEAQTSPTLLLGDADNNFVVEGGDLLAVTNNFGSTGMANGLLLGDANDDGSVDGGDLLAVTNNFGSTAGQTAAAIVSDEASDEAFAVYPEVTIAVKKQAVRLAEASGSLSTNAARDELLLLAAESVVSQRDDGFMETDLNEEESQAAAAETIFEVPPLV